MKPKGEVHFITVQKAYKKNDEIIPKVLMQGDWLALYGFKPGDKLIVSIKDDKIEIVNVHDEV